MGDSGYLPIEAHGAIGNLRTVALVGRDGCIDWCCLPDLDYPSVFASILDRRRGGHFSVAPVSGGLCEQRYLDDTNVLRNCFEAEGGRLVVTDFLPLRGDLVGGGDVGTSPEIHRLLCCEEGELEVKVEWAPRFDYARARTTLSHEGDCIVAASGTERMVLAGLAEGEIVDGEGGPTLRARVRLKKGEKRALVCRYGVVQATASAEETEKRLDETCDSWRSWVSSPDSRAWAGEWADLVGRSELALKLFTYAPTGAIAAAPTTSLPERLGGPKNWDYRFSWIRDSAMTVQALAALGHKDEARDFTQFANRSARSGDGRGPRLQLMYGLRGETRLREVHLSHLEGYRCSRPVRVGNWIASRWESDIYGELLGAVHELVRQGGEVDRDVWEFLSYVADEAARGWCEPDYGIWEMEEGPRQYVFSKWMCWVALDRAVEMAEQQGLRGDVATWKRERDAIHKEVLEKGYNPDVGAFVLYYGSRALDASNLLMPAMGFLPSQDERVQSTLQQVREKLTRHGLVYRYSLEDGSVPDEGSFLACAFWLVNALVLADRVDEAREHLHQLAARANHVGLYAEELDPTTGAFLGNFPQGLSHLGFINAALYLSRAEGRNVPAAPRGTEVWRQAAAKQEEAEQAKKEQTQGAAS